MTARLSVLAIAATLTVLAFLSGCTTSAVGHPHFVGVAQTDRATASPPPVKVPSVVDAAPTASGPASADALSCQRIDHSLAHIKTLPDFFGSDLDTVLNGMSHSSSIYQPAYQVYSDLSWEVAEDSVSDSEKAALATDKATLAQYCAIAGYTMKSIPG